MADYHIAVHRDISDTSEFLVQILDGAHNALAQADALYPAHVPLVARDLMSLVRVGDPDGAFIFDTKIREPSVAA